MPDPIKAGSLDQLRDRFKADWQAGRRPTLEAYLLAVEPSLQADLLGIAGSGNGISAAPR